MAANHLGNEPVTAITSAIKIADPNSPTVNEAIISFFIFSSDLNDHIMQLCVIKNQSGKGMIKELILSE